MANIDDELKVILNAERGDEVRAAIAAAIQKISTDREYKAQTLNIGDSENHRTLEGGPWNKVIVDVGEGGGSAIDLDYFGTVTANGYYDIWNTGWTPGHGWNGFHVDVPQHDANLAVKEITANGVYDPLDEGYDGYSKIVVSVPGAAGSGDLLTVSFYNGNLLLSTTQVPYGGQAVYQGDPPVGDTPFVGWNPDPSRVLNNMRCQAVFAGGLGGTIKDDWITIAKNCQAGLAQSKYPIGSTKELTYYLYGNPNLAYKTEMVLVDYNTQNFKSVNGKVPKTFWYSRYMMPNGMYGPMYSLDAPISLVKVTPVGNENPAALGWYNYMTRTGGTNKGYVPSTDTTVVSGRTYAMPNVPTMSVESGLQNLLAPVDRYVYPIKGSWSGSGTTLNFTTERRPSTPTDCKIFALNEAEYGNYKALFSGLAKQQITRSGTTYDVSLWNVLELDQATMVPSQVDPTYESEVTSEIQAGSDQARWYYDASAPDGAAEWGKDYGVYRKTKVTAPGNRSGASAYLSGPQQGSVSGGRFRFGFCI